MTAWYKLCRSQLKLAWGLCCRSGSKPTVKLRELWGGRLLKLWWNTKLLGSCLELGCSRSWPELLSWGRPALELLRSSCCKSSERSRSCRLRLSWSLLYLRNWCEPKLQLGRIRYSWSSLQWCHWSCLLRSECHWPSLLRYYRPWLLGYYRSCLLRYPKLLREWSRLRYSSLRDRQSLGWRTCLRRSCLRNWNSLWDRLWLNLLRPSCLRKSSTLGNLNWGTRRWWSSTRGSNNKCIMINRSFKRLGGWLRWRNSLGGLVEGLEHKECISRGLRFWCRGLGYWIGRCSYFNW